MFIERSEKVNESTFSNSTVNEPPPSISTWTAPSENETALLSKPDRSTVLLPPLPSTP